MASSWGGCSLPLAAGGDGGVAKRALDLIMALLLLVLTAPLMGIIALLIKADSPGPAIYRQRRMGRADHLFTMYKFRTMRVGTPEVATDRLQDAQQYLTGIGRFLRKSSLDELPQLWNIVRGDMSFVGPRPALHNQFELIALRRERGVDRLRPGLTGWAQIHGRDELGDHEKVALDSYYLEHAGLALDMKILLQTALAVMTARGVTQ